MAQAKGETGALPKFCVRDYNAKIDDALEFIPAVHEADCLTDARERAAELEKLGDEIVRRNRMIFTSGVMNQAFPVNREIGGRWFDEMGWNAEAFERANSNGTAPDNSGQTQSTPPIVANVVQD